MKKKFLSALVCSTLFVSVMPNVFAETDADKTEVIAPIQIGEYMQMGSYYGEPILWRCVAYEKVTGVDKENGYPITDSTDTVTEYEDGYLPLVVSDKIICIKAFDANSSANSTTGSHSRDLYEKRNHGSNYWGDSNMRSWLNSDASAGNVEWLCGNPPSAENIKFGYNPYADEAGFLTNFSEDERAAMQTAKIKSLVGSCEWSKHFYTTGNAKHEYNHDIDSVVQNYKTAYAEMVTDTMFLLDVQQANTIYKNTNILGDEYFRAKLTDKAAAYSDFQGQSGGLNGGANHNYWLRTPDATQGLYGYFEKYTDYYDTGTRYVTSYTTSGQGEVSGAYTCYGSFGVRPAFYLNTDTQFDGGSGSENAPFTGAYVPQPEIEVTVDGNTITNTSDYGGKAAVIVAYYDANGALKTVSSQTVEFAANGEEGDSYTVTIDGTDTHKVFVWNSFKRMKPLTIQQ